MPHNPQNRTVMSVLKRTEKQAPQLLDKELVNELFAGALLQGLAPYEAILDFEYTDVGVPESGKAIHSMYKAAVARSGTFKVFDGANVPELLWFTPHVNLAYRALHDLDHAEQYDKGRGTTKLADELYLNCLMAKRAYKYVVESGRSEAVALMVFFCVYHDTVGQVYYYREHNDFCVDQRANTAMLLAQCAGTTALAEGGTLLARMIMLGYLRACDVTWYDV